MRSTAWGTTEQLRKDKMGLFHKVPPKELLGIKNKIFLERGLPALTKNGFQKSPFSTAWFGRNNLNDFTYELCRLTVNSRIEIVTIHILREDRWIQIYLNIFDLEPEVKSLNQLDGVDGLQFSLPPNSLSKMRLRSDDYKGPPLFYMLFGKEHKIGSFTSKDGLEKRVNQLGDLIKYDMNDIDSFAKRWHELYRPMRTTWQGHQIDKVPDLPQG